MVSKKNLTKIQKEQVEEHVTKQLSKHIPTKTEFFKQQFKQHTSTAIIAAFSFLIALAWKDLIVNLIQLSIKPLTLQKYPYLTSLITALTVTLIAIIGIAIVTRWAKNTKVLVSETKTKS